MSSKYTISDLDKLHQILDYKIAKSYKDKKWTKVKNKLEKIKTKVEVNHRGTFNNDNKKNTNALIKEIKNKLENPTIGKKFFEIFQSKANKEEKKKIRNAFSEIVKNINTNDKTRHNKNYDILTKKQTNVLKTIAQPSIKKEEFQKKIIEDDCIKSNNNNKPDIDLVEEAQKYSLNKIKKNINNDIDFILENIKEDDFTDNTNKTDIKKLLDNLKNQKRELNDNDNNFNKKINEIYKNIFDIIHKFYKINFNEFNKSEERLYEYTSKEKFIEDFFEINNPSTGHIIMDIDNFNTDNTKNSIEKFKTYFKEVVKLYIEYYDDEDIKTEKFDEIINYIIDIYNTKSSVELKKVLSILNNYKNIITSNSNNRNSKINKLKGLSDNEYETKKIMDEYIEIFENHEDIDNFVKNLNNVLDKIIYIFDYYKTYFTEEEQYFDFKNKSRDINNKISTYYNKTSKNNNSTIKTKITPIDTTKIKQYIEYYKKNKNNLSVDIIKNLNDRKPAIIKEITGLKEKFDNNKKVFKQFFNKKYSDKFKKYHTDFSGLIHEVINELSKKTPTKNFTNNKKKLNNNKIFKPQQEIFNSAKYTNANNKKIINDYNTYKGNYQEFLNNVHEIKNIFCKLNIIKTLDKK